MSEPTQKETIEDCQLTIAAYQAFEIQVKQSLEQLRLRLWDIYCDQRERLKKP